MLKIVHEIPGSESKFGLLTRFSDIFLVQSYISAEIFTKIELNNLFVIEGRRPLTHHISSITITTKMHKL